jgi:hypothetical protein
MILFLTIIWSIGVFLFEIFGLRKAFKETVLIYPWYVFTRAILWPLYCVNLVLDKLFAE